eukprot:7387732-Prymnesium_polylepis.1
MLDPNEPGHMYPYEKAVVLKGGTNESDLPSKMKAAKSSLDLSEAKARDARKELHPSKVRATI